ncbi:condensation domain-containing protein [Streptomyces sp. NPDC006288]|uniref:condensation domain-containing protein n=1 Tax=Streptomyces sp. NPDC006288 TaxID=3156743 RepID=UPI0033AB0D74
MTTDRVRPADPAGRAAQAPPERTGPLTWVQRLWLPDVPDRQIASHEDNQFRELSLAVPLEPGSARRAVREVLARHEVVRSRIVGLGAEALQAVDAVEPGYEQVLRSVDLDGWEEAVSEARRTSFRLASQWPLKVLTGTREGKVRRVAVVVDHWASDGLGVLALLDDLASALDARARGADWVTAGPVEQPIDLALWESATPAGAAHLGRARAYWRQQFERLARDLADYRPAPVEEPPPGRAPLCFPGCTMTSVRLAVAANAVAERLQVPVAAVYLAAFSSAVGAAEQVGVVGTLMLSANRLTPAAMRSVRNAVMSAPVVLAVSRPGGFAETVVRAAAQQTQAFRYANADHRLTGGIADEVLGDLRDSAVTSAVFNFMPEAALRGDRVPDIARLAPFDVLEPMPPRATAAARMFMVVLRQDRVTLTLRWREDTSWQHAAEPMVRYLVDLITHEATPGAEVPRYGG